MEEDEKNAVETHLSDYYYCCWTCSVTVPRVLFLVLLALHSSRDIIERFPSTHIHHVVAEASPLSPLRHTRSRRPGL